ncbi:hypothetical protein EHW67_06955 [Arenibacter aquaticus]|uniref:Uncharacterized protein n=1 Tax=Arenibacter aquaticus TaxID=2489054 RepID=A0A430K741_9FLAO|nr:DUF6168 family protein [Arenibacter aquaticus]RTE54895.1 hypothetical protein EHW67_06955 [Arenibacter aquaticus]
MSKYNFLFSFYFSLGLVCLLVFGVHILVLYLLGLPLFGYMMVQAYLLNVFLAIVIFSFLFLFRVKWKDQIGFLFLGGSMLKFVFFFIFFYPVYKSDGQMETMEFISFFIPYLVCLLLETLFTAKMLNSKS